MKPNQFPGLRIRRAGLPVLILAVLASLVFTIGAQPVLAAGTITVDRTDDPAVTAGGAGAAACSGAANDCSLRGATLFANDNPGTTINLPAGTYQLTIDGNSEAGNCTNATIGDLDIAGNNTSIAGAGAATTIIQQTTAHDRVICVDQFLVGNFTFSISGVTITGGKETWGVGGGGMISGNPGDVTNVTNVTFSNNVANTSSTTGGSPVGGGLGNGAGALNVTGSTFTNNQSTGSGGGLYYSNNNNANSQTLNLTNSTFTNNVTTGGDGGAIKVTQASAAYTISSSTFTGNQAQGATSTGGAVVDESGTLNIDHSTFVNNAVTQSAARGGALGSVDGGAHNITVQFSRFAGNTAPTTANGTALYTGYGATTTATNNWWGCNGGPNTSGCGTIANGPAHSPFAAGVTNFNPWIVLTNTVSFTPILVNQNTTLTADFLHDSNGGSLTPSQVSVLLGLPVTWGGAVKGTLSGAQAAIQNTGTAQATFLATSAGAGSASATVDSGTATASITINRADTTTAITSESPDPTVTGQPYTVNFSVTSSTGSTPTAPSGTVTVSDGTDTCTGSIDGSGAGSCAITSNTAGAKTLTASYSGDPNFNPSQTAPGTAHTVNKADTTLVITANTPNPSVVGQPVTVKYSVTVNSPGSGTPIGTSSVTVTDGTVSCSATVAAGQCSITFTSAGTKTLTASYGGDANYNASPTPASVTQTVNPADTTTTITSDNPDPSDTGQAVTVTYTVAPVAPGAGTPTGNVTVSDGVDTCTNTVAAGQCSITLTTSGLRTLTAAYAGDGNFNASTSGGEPHTVNRFPTTTAITLVTPDPSVVGQSVTVNYSITAASGTPTGTVTVSDGTISCSASAATGQCSLTFTSAGARSLTASYAGDSTFSGSTSAPVSHQVNKADTTTTITSDAPDPSITNQLVTVTYSVAVNAPGAGTPTGNVTVSDGTISCTASAAAGQCSLTFTTAGVRSLTAAYAGDSNFNASTSTVETHTVNPPDSIPPDTTINSFPASPSNSSTATFTFSGTDNLTLPANLTFQCALDGGGFAACTSPVTFTGLADGSHTFQVRAIDQAANIDPTPASYTWLVDTVPPDTTILTSPANPTTSTSASFTFTGSDVVTPAASLTFQCQLDGGGFAACASPKAYSGLSLGSHTFQVRAVDAAGNIDPTPASSTWTIYATTSLLYNGDQIVVVGNSFNAAALLSSPAASCTSGKTITFTLDRNPLTGVAGAYVLGSPTTNASGQATLSVSTTGWQSGVYDLMAVFAGTSTCSASSNEVSLTAAGLGDAANGGGWYTLSGSGRINFGFTVSKVDNKCTANCAYKGQLLLINNSKWRLKGTLTGYVKTSTGTGAASGTGDLYWWNTALNGGLGDWALAKSGVSFTANFYDSGKTGKASTDAFGINIQYAPVAPQPSTLPNSTPQVLKGGDIKVK